MCLLAEAGLLEGRPATTHWAVARACRERYPGVLWQPERFITESDGLYCSGGLYASIDLSIYLVEQVLRARGGGADLEGALVETPRTWQAIYSAERRHGCTVTNTWARRSSGCTSTSAGEVALDKRCGRGRHELAHFRAALQGCHGEAPLEYLHRLRINAAKHLLEAERKTVQEVSVAVGYEDAAYFRSLFRRLTGIAPQAYRERFGVRRIPASLRASSTSGGTASPFGRECEFDPG